MGLRCLSCPEPSWTDSPWTKSQNHLNHERPKQLFLIRAMITKQYWMFWSEMWLVMLKTILEPKLLIGMLVLRWFWETTSCLLIKHCSGGSTEPQAGLSSLCTGAVKWTLQCEERDQGEIIFSFFLSKSCKKTWATCKRKSWKGSSGLICYSNTCVTIFSEIVLKTSRCC